MRTCPSRDSLLPVIALTSAALLAQQIALMRVLAATQGHHFAYFVIALALLGFGASGTLLKLLRKTVLCQANRYIRFALLGSALFSLLFLRVADHPGFWADVYLLPVEFRQWGLLLMNGLLAGFPFFAGAFALATTFSETKAPISRRYAANLGGSALGALAGSISLLAIDGESLYRLAAAACLIAALLVPLPFPWHQRNTILRWCIALGAGFLFPVLSGSNPLPVSQYKSTASLRTLPDISWESVEHHIRGKVEIAQGPSLRWNTDVSLNFRGEAPALRHLFVDGNIWGPLVENESQTHILRYTPLAWLSELPARSRILILGAGQNATALSLATTATEVLVSEAHPVVRRHLRSALENWISPNNIWPAGDSRRVLARIPDQSVDWVCLPPVGSFGGGLGLTALQENHLLTEEGIREVWRVLSKEGGFSIPVWLDHPPRRSLRLASLLQTLFTDTEDETASRHVIVLRGWNSLQLFVFRQAIPPDFLNSAQTFATRMGFDLLYPADPADKTAWLHSIPDGLMERGLPDLLENRNPLQYRSYLFQLAPPTDQRPYFEHFLRLSTLRQLAQEHGMHQLPFLELGPFLGAGSLLLLTIASLFLIGGPLLGNRTLPPISLFLFFASIGAGFMFVEIVLIHLLVFILGDPILSAAWVISLLLLGMGLGSWNSEETSLPLEGRSLATYLGIVLLILLGAAVVLFRLIPFMSGWPAFLPWATSGLLLLGVGFFLGKPFPRALRRVQQSYPEWIPWAWAVNGCFSVIAPSLVTLLLLGMGFPTVFLGGVALYGVAALAALGLGNSISLKGKF